MCLRSEMEESACEGKETHEIVDHDRWLLVLQRRMDVLHQLVSQCAAFFISEFPGHHIFQRDSFPFNLGIEVVELRYQDGVKANGSFDR